MLGESSGKKIVKATRAVSSGMDRGFRRNMLWSAWVVAVLCFCSGIAGAHPPKEVTLAYDGTARILKVTILHNSPMPSRHYIKSVTIEKNNQPLATYPYKGQTGNEFTHAYEVSAQAGDTLTVTVTCNLYGSLKETLIVAQDAGSNPI